MRMKLAIIALLSATLVATAQMPRALEPSGEMKTTTAPGFLTDVWGVIAGEGMTNLSASVYGTYTPALKEWGGGFALDRNIPLGGGVSTSVGIGLDYYDDQFYSVAGQLSLQAAIRPLAGFGGWATNIVVTPFGRVGLGTPFGDGSINSGSLETIEAVGANIHLVKLFGGHLGAFGMYGTRTGLGDASGTFYGGGINWCKRF